MLVDLHLKALELVKKYKRCEKDIIDVLQEIDRERVYLQHGCSSLFRYCVEKLQLSESDTYRFIQVARKSVEVPALKQAIAEGLLTVSKASRVAPVITGATEEFWIQLASTKTHREVEREVTKERPKEIVRERLRVLTPVRSELRFSVTVETEKKLKRAQEVFRTKNFEETLEALLDYALPRRDPVERARRAAESDVSASPRLATLEKGKKGQVVTKTGLKPATCGVKSGVPSEATSFKPISHEVHPGAASTILNQKFARYRVAIPASVRHAVYLRDGGRCAHPNCGETRWTEIHHVKPVAEGGANTLENLVTFCWAHHRGVHRPVGFGVLRS